MPSRIDPAAATNAFARQVQLGANMRANDQSEQMNAFALAQAQREDEAARQPKYDPMAFQHVGGIATQIASLGDPTQKRAAFKQAILGNGPAFDALGMPHADALAKVDTLDDAALDATLAKLASFAPKAAPQKLGAGDSLVSQRPDGTYGADFTAPKAGAEGDDGFSLSPGQVRFDSKGRRIAGVAASAPTPTGEPPNFQKAAELRKEYNSQSATFRGVADSFQRIRDSASDPSAAGDLSLIFNFMKVLDPGSTVREGEFATAQNAGGVDDRIAALYNRVTKGERLSEAQRADFVGRATTLYKGQEKRFQTNVTDKYTGLAKRYGLDPQEVIGEINAATDAPPPQAPPANAAPVRVNSPAEAAKLPPGTVFVTPDGRTKVVPPRG